MMNILIEHMRTMYLDIALDGLATRTSKEVRILTAVALRTRLNNKPRENQICHISWRFGRRRRLYT